MLALFAPDLLASDAVSQIGAALDCAAWHAGQRLAEMLRAKVVEGVLVARGHAATNPAGPAQELSPDVAANGWFDVPNGTFRVGGSTTIAVTISRGQGDRSGGQSFRNDDDRLVERMHEMIADRRAKNVSDAARLIAPEAKILGSLGSVETRLRKLYGVKYPTRTRR